MSDKQINIPVKVDSAAVLSELNKVQNGLGDLISNIMGDSVKSINGAGELLLKATSDVANKLQGVENLRAKSGRGADLSHIDNQIAQFSKQLNTLQHSQCQLGKIL